MIAHLLSRINDCSLIRLTADVIERLVTAVIRLRVVFEIMDENKTIAMLRALSAIGWSTVKTR